MKLAKIEQLNSNNVSRGERSTDKLHNISEKNSRSNSQDSLKNANKKVSRRSPDPTDFAGSSKIDS